MTEAKPFQLATVEAVIRAFADSNGSRRFLVADEVGLGKTVVAQQVMSSLMENSHRPLVVFYVCSNLAIAAQNRRKLLEVLPGNERKSAECPVDRLTLMPAAPQPEHPRLHLYTLTPDTSVPIRKGKRRDGRQEERALIHALVRTLWPRLLEIRGENLFQRNCSLYWDSWVDWQSKKANNKSLQEAFYHSVHLELQLSENQDVTEALDSYSDDLEIIAHLRNALASSAIEEIRPHLIIFDEFQRFRDLLSDEIDQAAARVIGRLRGDGMAEPPALLLLSATPYRLYSKRFEDINNSSHHKEFFELVKFLYGGSKEAEKKRRECQAFFAELEEELRKGNPTSERALMARDIIQAKLRPIISRTERSSHPMGWSELATLSIPASIHADDFKVFKHFCECLDERHRSGAVPYWISIPVPMQAMGPRYVVWRSSKTVSAQDTPVLTEAMRNKLSVPSNWPHPKLRALQSFITPNQLALPWVSPSLPWWPLRGNWKSSESSAGKVLVFSRFRAVPQAVAAFLSYNMESSLLEDQKINYSDVTKRRLLQASDSRHALLGLFHPSPWLVKASDPLSAGSKSLRSIFSFVRRQIKTALDRLDVGIEGRVRSRPTPTWILVARLDYKAGNWPFINNAWRDMHRQNQREDNPDAGLGQLLQRWNDEAERPIDRLSKNEFEALVNHSLASPGMAIGRALCRHWPDALGEEGYRVSLEASWNGLRTYLDQRFFVAALGGQESKYPRSLQRAVLDGNLEAVLDEHIWITSRLQSLDGSSLAGEIKDSLKLRSSPFFLHDPSDKQKTFSLRCNTAIPFIEARNEVAQNESGSTPPLRSDELRKAFNTPFWPHVLTTTSVGQEGLDFHVWCQTVVHWDLCSNPVDLEQREGRIQRYGGLAVRQALARLLGEKALSQLSEGKSPWAQLGSLADKDPDLSDESGLCPWWVCKDAEIKRYVIEVPASEQVHRLAWMKEQRLLYRLALGQPNQEDLIEVLASRGDIQPEEIRKAMLELSAWFGNRNGRVIAEEE